MMGLPRWRRTGGHDFVFFHSHPGFEWDDLSVTTAYQEMLCMDFQWATVLAVEQGQRWRCPAYNPKCATSRLNPRIWISPDGCLWNCACCTVHD
jgi:hypothetical protein